MNAVRVPTANLLIVEATPLIVPDPSPPSARRHRACASASAVATVVASDGANVAVVVASAGASTGANVVAELDVSTRSGRD